MTYTEHAQRLLDETSSRALDRIAGAPAIAWGVAAPKATGTTITTPVTANLGPFNPVTDHDTQEARSLHLSNEVIGILRLSSGNWAVFNRAHELQAILPPSPILERIKTLNTPPKAGRPTARATTLEDLGL